MKTRLVVLKEEVAHEELLLNGQQRNPFNQPASNVTQKTTSRVSLLRTRTDQKRHSILYVSQRTPFNGHWFLHFLFLLDCCWILGAPPTPPLLVLSLPLSLGTSFSLYLWLWLLLFNSCAVILGEFILSCDLAGYSPARTRRLVDQYNSLVQYNNNSKWVTPNRYLNQQALLSMESLQAGLFISDRADRRPQGGLSYLPIPFCCWFKGGIESANKFTYISPLIFICRSFIW